jgi:hypothetical protein
VRPWLGPLPERRPPACRGAFVGRPAAQRPCPLTPRPRSTAPPPQAGFKRELIKEVHAFVADAQTFRREWDTAGPMVPGLDPMEAMERLRKFQQMFEVGRGCTAAEGREGPATRAGTGC